MIPGMRPMWRIVSREVPVYDFPWGLADLRICCPEEAVEEAGAWVSVRIRNHLLPSISGVGPVLRAIGVDGLGHRPVVFRPLGVAGWSKEFVQRSVRSGRSSQEKRLQAIWKMAVDRWL